jgi:hypothetical protein
MTRIVYRLAPPGRIPANIQWTRAHDGCDYSPDGAYRRIPYTDQTGESIRGYRFFYLSLLEAA